MIEIVEHTTKTLTKESNTNIRQNRVLGKNIIRKRKVLFNDKRNNSPQDLLEFCTCFPLITFIQDVDSEI